jgi:MFS family permease
MERNIKLLSIFNFFLDFKFHSAVLIIYFARVTGSYALATSLFSVVMLSSALFEVPTGIYSDLIGRKKTILIGALSATISAVLYATGHSYWPLFLGAIFEGLSRAWYSGNNDALLYDSVKESAGSESFAHHLGRTSSMFQLALMFGAVIGSILAQWSFALIMWLSVIPQALCFITALYLRDPKHITKGKANIFSHIKISAFYLWNNKRLRLVSLADILGFAFGEAAFNFGAAFIGTLWPIWAIGFARMISYGGAFVSYWFSGKIIKKIGDRNILIIANIVTRILNFFAYGIPSVFSPIIMTSSSIFYGATEVSKNNIMQQEYTHEQRATLSSMSSFFGSVGYGLFIPVIGLVADAYGPAKALIMVQFCMLSVLYIFFKMKRYENSRH